MGNLDKVLDTEKELGLEKNKVMVVKLESIKPLTIVDERQYSDEGKVWVSPKEMFRGNTKNRYTMLIYLGEGKALEYYSGKKVFIMKNSIELDEEQVGLEQIKKISFGFNALFNPMFFLNDDIYSKIRDIENENVAKEYLATCIMETEKSISKYENEMEKASIRK